jgi:hypothetical protein
MERYLLKGISICLLVYTMSCGNNRDNQQINLYHNNDSVWNNIKNDGIVNNYKYYLKNSIIEIKKQKWKNIIIDTVNDEYNKWVEATFYITNNEWIKIEAENSNKISASAIETNTNYFLTESPFKVNDDVAPLILKDAAQFSFDEGKLSFSMGSVEIKANCLKDVNDIKYEKILEARVSKNKDMLPDNIKNCKITTVRILNIK